MNTEIVSWGLVTILSVGLFVSGWISDQAARERDKAVRQGQDLAAKLEWIRLYLSDREDIEDGHDGKPVPNWAMSMQFDIDEMNRKGPCL